MNTFCFLTRICEFDYSLSYGIFNMFYPKQI
jgi:hypothetical protein